ncbi:MAG: TraR/DksA family transcriptional regulator [Streptosporangiaceae bacterium]|jgi:DnaK suppressor protein|nr:TraR/DksA family transcriptional regulator [Streptosporangiaceae bacterium]
MAQRSRDASSLEQLLTAERTSTLHRIAALTRDWDAIVESSTLVSVDDEHDPEGATIAFERSQIDSLIGQAQQRLTDLDHALERVRDGTYGRCERCGAAIGAERLVARPTARTCISCANAR